MHDDIPLLVVVAFPLPSLLLCAIPIYDLLLNSSMIACCLMPCPNQHLRIESAIQHSLCISHIGHAAAVFFFFLRARLSLPPVWQLLMMNRSLSAKSPHCL
jgi:hypothetical protein